MEKKELNNKELKKVTGGVLIDDGWTTCPMCTCEGNESDFSPYSTQDGCSRIKHLTCPECKHEWTK